MHCTVIGAKFLYFFELTYSEFTVEINEITDFKYVKLGDRKLSLKCDESLRSWDIYAYH